MPNHGTNNKSFLEALGEESRNKILDNIAAHYGITKEETMSEVSDKDAECLYEYIANDHNLRLRTYEAYNFHVNCKN